MKALFTLALVALALPVATPVGAAVGAQETASPTPETTTLEATAADDAPALPDVSAVRNTAVSLEGQLRRLSDRLALGIDKTIPEARYQRVAVLPFEESGAGAQENQLGKLIAAELNTSLARDHQFMAVERAQLAQIIDEVALSQSGALEEERELGQIGNADILVLGTVAAAGDQYLVNAKVVDASSGRVVHAEDAPLPAADLVALSSEAVVLRSTSGAVFRSALIPGWGQFYNRQPLKGALFIGAEVLSGALAVTFLALGASRYGDYGKLGPGTAPEVFRNTRTEAASYYEAAFVFGLTTLGVHLVQVFDAALSSPSYE